MNVTFRLLVASGAVALSAWLLPASVHVVGWDAAGPQRLAHVRSWWELAAWLMVAVSVAAAARGRLGPLATARWTRRLAPLNLLWLWTVPYLPGLPERIPLLLVLAGPVRWVVLASAVIGCGLVWRERRGDSDSTGRLRWPGARVAFVASCILFGALGSYVKGTQGLGGDEPHYLIISHSLLSDHDLRIENNHDEGHYRAFFTGQLPPHFLRRGLDEVIYSVHAPGLPALLLPGYAVAGAWGSVVLVVLMAALAAALMFATAERLTNRAVAWVTWAAVACTVPFAPHAWLIYPELPAALVMAAVAWWILQPAPAPLSSWVWRGVAVGLLPWLHIKYSALLAGATLCLLAQAWPRVRRSTALLVPMVVSGVLWLASFQMMYGTPNPLVVYGYGDAADLDPGHVPRGVLGLLFDQEFGILLYSPVFALVPLGAWAMWQTPRLRGPLVGLVGTTAALTLSFTLYYMWWGGYSAPARFIVPALPLTAPLIALGVARARTAAARGMVGALVLTSVGAFLALMAEPAQRLQFNDRDGTSRLVGAWQGGVDFTSVLPTFIQADWTSQVPAVMGWVAASGLGALAAWALGRRASSVDGAFWSGAAFTVVFILCLSLFRGSSLSDEEQRALVRAGQQTALAAYDGERMTWYRYRPAGPIEHRAWRQHVAITQRSFDHRWRALGRTRRERDRVAGPFALPPGRYRVKVWFEEGAPLDPRDEVWVTYHRGPGLMSRRSVTAENPVVMDLVLPVTFDPVWIGATSGHAAEAIREIQIESEKIVPRDQRDALENIRQAEAIGGVPGRYVVHLDDNVLVEDRGLWVRGETEARMVVTPGTATSLGVLVRNGRVPGPVSVRIADEEQTTEMAAREELRFRVPLAGDQPFLPIEIYSARGFRPSDHTPGSRDRRWLGSWVQVTLD